MVVDEEAFPIAKGLRRDRVQRFAQVHGAVVDRHIEGHEWRALRIGHGESPQAVKRADTVPSTPKSTCTESPAPISSGTKQVPVVTICPARKVMPCCDSSLASQASAMRGSPS